MIYTVTFNPSIDYFVDWIFFITFASQLKNKGIMKIEIKNWSESKAVEKLVKLSIKKFRFVKDREDYLLSKGLNVKVSAVRDYKGLGNHEDYLFKNKNMVERRIIVGRPYERYRGQYMGNERPSRTAVCVILKNKADEIIFKKVTK